MISTMKKTCVLILSLCLMMTSSALAVQTPSFQKYSYVFFDTFDTVITILGYASDKAVFDRAATQAEAAFKRYHMIFDQYHPYEGIQNVYTLNHQAAQGPVEVPQELFDLLSYCKEMQPKMRNTVNVAMGTVLSLWHEARELAESDPEHATLPKMAALQEAARHTNMDDVVLDADKHTVFFADPVLKLDVGAVAKGYATELVAKQMLESDLSHFIINAGGNVRTGNPPLDGRSNWGVGIQDPDAAIHSPTDGNVLDVLYMHNLSSVTSGDYQRFFTLDGKRYHHIIDPLTLMPSQYMRAVTILTEDSGLADMLSTALFLMSQEDGAAFIQSLGLPVDALWVLNDGSVVMTEGAKKMAHSQGAGN